MPGRNETKGRGQGSTGHGRPMGHGGGSKHEGQDGEIGQHVDATPGRSESSPGHLKKAAGARNARDYAPGRGSEHGES